MKMKHKRRWKKREQQLAAVIGDWVSSIVEDGKWRGDDPWIGVETYDHMARAAISVLRGCAESQEARERGL